MKREFPYAVPGLAIGPATLDADTTPVGTDLQGVDAALILIAVGIGGITFSGTNKIEFVISHSEDDVTYTPVAAGDVILGANCDAAVGAGGIVRSLVAAHAAPSIADLSYIGGKRYLKALPHFSGTHGTGTPIAVVVVKGLAHRAG